MFQNALAGLKMHYWFLTVDITMEAHKQEHKTGMVAGIPIVTHNLLIGVCVGVLFGISFLTHKCNHKE